MRQGAPRYQGDLDLLIQRAEAERLQTLSELQPVFRQWQGIRVSLGEKSGRTDALGAARSSSSTVRACLGWWFRLRDHFV